MRDDVNNTNIFVPKSTPIKGICMDRHNQLELMLAIRRICRKAVAEGKTHMRKATLRKMDVQINQMQKLQNQNVTHSLIL